MYYIDEDRKVIQCMESGLLCTITYLSPVLEARSLLDDELRCVGALSTSRLLMSSGEQTESLHCLARNEH